MALPIAAIIGFSKVLTAPEIVALSNDYYPAATAGSFNDILTLDNGTMTIPAGFSASAPSVRFGNNNSSSAATLDLGGVLNVTGASTKSGTGSDGIRDDVTNKRGGILLGEWTGVGTYNITGTLNASANYLQLRLDAGAQTMNINGGTVSVKGLTTNAGSSTINLTNGGTLEIAEILSDAGTITRNYNDGTVRALGDINETQAITLGGTGAGTTFDANGHTFTLSGTLSGTGKASIANSGSGGKVVVPENRFPGDLTLASGATLDITSTETKDSYTITAGAFANYGTVLLNGESLVGTDYAVVGNKIVRPIKKTITGTTTWSALWSGGTAPTETDSVELTVGTTATLTFDDTTTVAGIKFESEDGNKLTIAGATNLTAGTYDFVDAVGKVTFDCTGLTGCTTLLSGAVSGTENIDTVGVNAPDGYQIYADATGVYLTRKDYIKFLDNPGMFTWAGGNNDFYKGTYNLFSICTGSDTGTSYTGNVNSSTFPGYEGTEITPWHAFSSNSGYKYKAPGYVVRFDATTGSGNKTIDASFNYFSFGGLLVESGATGYSFKAESGSDRSTMLGDQRTSGGVDTWFIFKEDFTFNRHGDAANESAFKLFGAINFDIVSGKSVTLNKATQLAYPNLDTGTHTQLKMHGEGQILVNTLTATGDVTLDYSDLGSRVNTNPYIDGTVTIDASTKIKLPAGLAAGTPFKMATTVSGGTDGKRTIYLGDTAVEKFVSFANGAITWYHTAYAAEVTANGKWSELNWNPARPTAGFPAGADFTLTNNGSADVTTVNVDDTVTANKLTIVSATKVLKFGSPSHLTATTYDFSQAPGGVGFSVTGGWTVPDTLKDYIRKNNIKVVFDSDDTNGATLDYGSTQAARINESPWISSHVVFNGGTHTFKGTSENAGQSFGANATADNPTFYAKNGATVNWYSRNPCGWSVQANKNGIIRIDGTSKIKTLNSESGTWYWVQQFYLDAGAQLEIAAATTCLTGGGNENAPHFFMPASENGTATISSSGSGSFRLTKDSYPGIGVSVGEGSTLLVTASLASTATQSYIAKYGAGALKFTGSTTGYQGGLQVKAGRIIYESATAMMAAATVSIDSGAQFVFGAADNSFANVISGAGALVKDGTGTTTTLTGANTYSGGTTVTAGTLKVAEGASIGTGNYSVAAGAELYLPSTFRPSDAKLIGTSAGTVGITLTSGEYDSFTNGTEVALIAVEGGSFAGAVKIYNLSGDEYLNTFRIDDNGKIAVTKVDQKTPPFNLTTPPEMGYWTAENQWTDSSDPAKAVVSDDWAIKVGANIAIAQGQECELLLDTDQPITLGHFNVANNGTLAISDFAGGTLVADTIVITNAGTFKMGTAGITVNTSIDDSESTGATTLDFATHAASITAGANTIVRAGGTGALTIGAGKTATITNGVWAGTVTRDNASTIRYAGTAGTTSVPYVDGDSNTGLVIYAADFGDLGDNGLQFKNSLTRKFENGFVVTGGRFVTGNQAGYTQNFTMDGGSITVTGNAGPASSSASTLFAHWNSTVNFTMNGGTLTAENAAARLGWDGKAYVTVAGGTFRTKGIASGGSDSTTPTGRNNDASFTLSGGTLELGDYGIQAIGSKAAYTFSSGTVRAYANTSISVAHASGLQVTGNVTFDVGTYTLTLPGKVSGSGNITVSGTGTLVLSGDASSYTGVLTVPAGMTVKASESWLTGGRLSFADTTCNLVMYDKTSYDGRFTMTLADGSATPANITVKSSADESHDYGTVTVTGTAPNVTVSYTPWVDGKGALYAWEFNGNLKSTGRTNSDMGQDHGPYYTDDKTRVYAYSQPHNGLTWPTEFTTAIACTLPTNANVCLVGWGQATPGGIALTSGDVSKHEVKMVYWQNNQHYTELATMSVPNAFDSEHLYLFAKTADGVKVYLDGSLVVNYSGALSLGVGVQVGTVYQGVGNTGLVRLDTVYSSTNTCKSAVNTLRIYDAVLGPNSIAELKAEFPYTSPKGTYTRALTGTANDWNETDKWTRTKTGEEPSFVSVPAADATVVLTAKDAATIANNLTASAAYEAINLSGEGTITITAADDNTNKITSGSVQIGANAVVKYSAVDLGNTPIEIMTGKKLTIDASMIDVTKYFTTTVIPLTGLVTAADDESTQLEITPPTAAAGSGRTVSVAKSATEHIWEVTITVEPKPFVYTVAQGSETGTWTWGSQEVTAEQVAAQTTGEIQKAGAGTATLTPQAGMVYTIAAGTLKFTSAPTAPCSITNVAAGATFDLNGIENTEVANNFVVTLNGGTLTNSGDNRGILKSLTVLANSYVDVGEGKVIWIQNAKEGYATTTLALGTFTLTKNGLGEFGVVSTTVSGTGIIDVEGGKLWMQESSNFADSTIKVGAAGKFHVRSDRACTAHNIQGVEGGTIEVGASGITGFNLSGTLTFVEGGTYGTITNAANAVAKVGSRRNLTFAGAGTVDVTMQDSEAIGGQANTAFTLADSASTTVGTITYDGADVTAKCTKSTNTFTVNTADCAAKDSEHSYLTLRAAIVNTAAGSTITALDNIATGDGIAVDKNITLDGAGCELTGTGFTGTGTLTIIGGRIGVTGLPTAYALQGGEYPAAKVTGEGAWTVASGYHLVDIYSTEALTYSKQIAIGSSPAAEDEKSYPVTPKGGSEVVGAIVVKTSDLVEKGIVSEGATPAQVSAALGEEGANHYPTWQNVVLGLDNNVETSIPYPAPVQGTSTTQVSLKLGSNVSVDTTTGAKVTYKVMTKGATGSYEYEQGEWSYDATATLDLPTTQEGVKYYKFDVIVTPAK